MNIALTRDEADRVAQLAEERPGVSRHRTGKAVFRLGERVLDQQPEALDYELAVMSREDELRRKRACKGGPSTGTTEVQS